MGGSTSKTRKLTVENDDPTSVIKVSEDVVDRIRGNQEVRQPDPYSSQHNTPQMMAAPFFLQEPSLTTLQLRQAHVVELKKNDEYWEERLKQLEDRHKKMNEIMEQETQKAIEELSGKRTPVAKKIEPPCLDSKKAVMECYACYPNEPMRCAKVVQAFQQCVDHKRSQIIASRG